MMFHIEFPRNVQNNTTIEFSRDTKSMYKNQFYLYILTINMWKPKLKIHYLQSLKVKYIGCKSNNIYTGFIC